MTTVELDQFLVDPQPLGSNILVDANWLQSRLKEKHRLELQVKQLDRLAEDRHTMIECCMEKIRIYKDMIEEYRKLRTLNTYDY